MGTWGPALYSDDLAAELRSDFRGHIGDGLTAEQALEKLCAEYARSLKDPDEAPVFWLAIADSAWQLGRPVESATVEALHVIEVGADLKRWDESKLRVKRDRVLQQLAAKLRSPAPAARRVAKRFVAANDWSVGELIAFRLASGNWTLFRVVGHHTDKGGRNAICEPLDWTGATPPDCQRLPRLNVRPPLSPVFSTQFMLGEPSRVQDVRRFARVGASSSPAQRAGGFLVFVFPHFDRLLREVFGLE